MGEYWTKSGETNKFTLLISLVINLLSRSMRLNIAVGSFGYRQRAPRRGATCGEMRQTVPVAIFIQRCLHNDIGSLSAIIVYKNWE
jgi:hypothetical protein